MNNFYNIVKSMNNDELNGLLEAIKDRQTSISFEKKSAFKVGDMVKFMTPTKDFNGKIIDIGRTKASVETNRGRYRVPLNMLESA